jgi:hypothetical protein
MAKSLAGSSGLEKRIKSGEITLHDILQRSLKLWQDMLIKKERGIAEVELAVILAAISENVSVEVSDLLIRVSLADRPPVAWVSALARKFHQERPVNQEIKFSERRGLPLKISNFNERVPTLDINIPLSQDGIHFTSINLYSDDDQIIAAA